MTKRKTKALTESQLEIVFKKISKKRHAEKNKTIIQLCFFMGLNAQEIANLSISDVANIDLNNKLTLSDHIILRPKINTRSSAKKRESHAYNISKDQLDSIILRVAEDIRNGEQLICSNYYPTSKKYQKSTRTLPLKNQTLGETLKSYLSIRERDLNNNNLKEDIPNQPFLISQKKTSYSPNTLQEHIKLILAVWSGIKGATSLSGRKTFILAMQQNGMSLEEIKYYLGHTSVSTTARHMAPEESRVLTAYDHR